jgi:hypothetical protein
MSRRKEEYRKTAEACVHATERMRDPKERVIMLEIAKAYMRLADLLPPPKTGKRGKKAKTGQS